MSAPTFAYCESSGAVALGTWHIRRLSSEGPMHGGGVDTPALCGRDLAGGWDLELPVVTSEAIAGAARVNDSGRRDVCPACVDALKTVAP